MRSRCWPAFILILSSFAWGQQKPPPLPPPLDPLVYEGLDQKKIDEAIEAGVAFLKRLKAEKGGDRTDELVLWTFVQAGVPHDDPLFVELLERMLKDPLEATYRVSLQAMILQKVDEAKHLNRLIECAQFLADNQCKNGQWSYGQPIAPVTATGGTASKPKAGTQAKPRIPVTPRRTPNGPAGGDNSNTQYAALGVRACHDAGIVFPKAMITDAREAWVQSQQAKSAGKKGAVASGPAGAPPRGWNYTMAGSDAYGSMTAGGAGCVVIYDHILGMDWKKDPVALSGIAWLGAHFRVDDNPEYDRDDKVKWHHYYLYALERVGILFGTEKMGSNYWYKEGVKYLLETQSGGKWGDDTRGGGWEKDMRDTCYGILFLRRATKPLIDVASTDSSKTPSKP